MDKIKGLRF